MFLRFINNDCEGYLNEKHACLMSYIFQIDRWLWVYLCESQHVIEANANLTKQSITKIFFSYRTLLRVLKKKSTFLWMTINYFIHNDHLCVLFLLLMFPFSYIFILYCSCLYLAFHVWNTIWNQLVCTFLVTGFTHPNYTTLFSLVVYVEYPTSIFHNTFYWILHLRKKFKTKKSRFLIYNLNI